MIPLSNPLDTRSVWLRTGSETGWLRECKQAQKEKMKVRQENRSASRHCF